MEGNTGSRNSNFATSSLEETRCFVHFTICGYCSANSKYRHSVTYRKSYIHYIKIQDLTSFAAKFNFIVEEYVTSKGKLPPPKRRSRNVVYVATIEKVMNVLHEMSVYGCMYVCMCVHACTRMCACMHLYSVHTNLQANT